MYRLVRTWIFLLRLVCASTYYNTVCITTNYIAILDSYNVTVLVLYSWWCVLILRCYPITDNPPPPAHQPPTSSCLNLPGEIPVIFSFKLSRTDWAGIFKFAGQPGPLSYWLWTSTWPERRLWLVELVRLVPGAGVYWVTLLQYCICTVRLYPGMSA